MALIVKQDKRVEHPSEPGTWFVLRLPLTAGDLADIPATATQARVKIDTIYDCLREWSYPEPVTKENVERLDLETIHWLSTEVFLGSALPSPDEKKDSSSSSLPITDPVEAGSL